MNRLANEPGAAGFMKIWQLPETQRLKTQTLDKLALAPWLLSGTNRLPSTTNYAAVVHQNHPAELLRPLLDDLVQEQCYLEMRGVDTASGQLALAIRLDANQAGKWETNLASIFEPLATQPPQVQAGAPAHDWRIHTTNSAPAFPHFVRHVELARAGDWTILGLAADQNMVFTQVLTRVQSTQIPAVPAGTNEWFQSSFDLKPVAAMLGTNSDPSQDWPRITVSVSGDGTNLVTGGEAKFAKPLAFEIESWNIPTNLIHGPLQSFTAAQGLKPWLSSIAFWRNLKVDATPNQFFCWSQAGSPFLGSSAAPVAHAKSVMAKIGPAIMDAMNPVLTSNRMGKWEKSTNSDEIMWRAPIISPFIQSVAQPEGSFLFASLSPFALTNSSPSPGTFRELSSLTNVVYFDREITSPRVEAWMYVTQLFRLIFRRVQLPPEAASIAWFKAAGPLLAPSSTTVARIDNSTLSLRRTSPVGFTAPELHLLADWLESSRFPLQLNANVEKLAPIPARRTVSQ
jgi:hypothetical protein